MALLPKYRDDVPRVARFSLLTRIAHWGHALTFFLCFASGMAIYFGNDLLALPFGGLRGASIVHKASALGLTALVLLYVVFGFRSFARWWREVFRFDSGDIAFLTRFPGKFFGVKADIPPQTKLNGGEKVNSVVTSLGVLALAISGFIIWFPEHFSSATVQWSYLIHAVAMIVATSVALLHAYLGSLHPVTGESFWGMWRGTVRSDWAKKHHGRWLEDIDQRQGKTRDDAVPHPEKLPGAANGSGQ